MGLTRWSPPGDYHIRNYNGVILACPAAVAQGERPEFRGSVAAGAPGAEHSRRHARPPAAARAARVGRSRSRSPSRSSRSSALDGDARDGIAEPVRPASDDDGARRGDRTLAPSRPPRPRCSAEPSRRRSPPTLARRRRRLRRPATVRPPTAGPRRWHRRVSITSPDRQRTHHHDRADHHDHRPAPPTTTTEEPTTTTDARATTEPQRGCAAARRSSHDDAPGWPRPAPRRGRPAITRGGGRGWPAGPASAR